MLGFILGIISLGLVYVVPAGNVGVVTQFGAVQSVAESGLHFKAPLGIQSVKNMSVRTVRADVKAEAGSKDLQVINTVIAVNYHIDGKKAGTIYKNIGDNKAVEERILNPAVSETVKASFSKKTAEEALTKRAELKADIDKELEKRLEPYDIVLDDVSIVDVNFSKEFNIAIEQKQVAEQKAKEAVYRAQQAKNDAEAAINKAQGEAEAQRLQQTTLSEPLLRKLWIEKWNGTVPTVVTGSDSMIFQLPK